MRTYTIINLVGLIISLTGCIILARYINQELSVDNYIPNVDRVMSLCTENNGMYFPAESKHLSQCGNPFNPLNDKAVEAHTTITRLPNTHNVKIDKVFISANIVTTDSIFLHIFPYKVYEGHASLSSSQSMIITRKFAEKLWPGESAIGKELFLFGTTRRIVTGVVEEPKTKKTIEFDILVVDQDESLPSYRSEDYFLLKNNESYKDFNKRCEQAKSYIEDEEVGIDRQNIRYTAIPLKQTYFMENLGRIPRCNIARGNKENIEMLCGAGIMLLFIGLLNFFNILTVISNNRVRDFAIKMTFGASLRVLFKQVMTENFVITTSAMLISWIMVHYVSIIIETYYGLTFYSSVIFDIALSIAVIIILPLIMSAVSIVQIRKSMSANADIRNRTGILRNTNLCLQHVISFVLIIISGYSVTQVHYMLNKELGYKSTDIISLDLAPYSEENVGYFAGGEADEKDMQRRQENIKKAIKKIEESPLFLSWEWNENQSSLLNIGKDSVNGVSISKDFDSPSYRGGYIFLTTKSFDIYNIKLLEGTAPNKIDYNKDISYVYITENTKKILNIKDITKETIIVDGGESSIAGVTNDINTFHLALSDKPTVMIVRKNSKEAFNTTFRIIANYQHGMRKEAIAFLQKLYDEINDGGEMEYKLIEDELDKLYLEDKQTALVLTTFAFMSIFVSCLGIFGITIYDIQHRRREIAIRKVNGAKLKDILIIMTRNYLISLSLAIVIGTPLSIYILHFYIDKYAHHVPLTAWYFVAAASLMLLLTLLTVFCQIRKAAKENPAEVMKSE